MVGRDPSTDLALLQIDPNAPRDFEPLPLGDSKRVRVGDAAIAIGHPFGLERSLTLGVVSSTDREIDAPDGSKIEDVVQTDAAINPGNSGGPLLDAEGRVIGVNSQGRGGGSGIAFAVPVDTLKRVLPALRAGTPASSGRSWACRPADGTRASSRSSAAARRPRRASAGRRDRLGRRPPHARGRGDVARAVAAAQGRRDGRRWWCGAADRELTVQRETRHAPLSRS